MFFPQIDEQTTKSTEKCLRKPGRGRIRGSLSAPRGHTEAPFPPRFVAHRTRRSRRDRRPTDRRQHPGPGVHRLRGCGLRRSENSSSRPRRRGDVIWRSRRWAASCCASPRRGPGPSTSSRLWNRYDRARRARNPVGRSQPPDSARPRVRPIFLFRPFSSNVRATCPEPG